MVDFRVRCPKRRAFMPMNKTWNKSDRIKPIAKMEKTLESTVQSTLIYCNVLSFRRLILIDFII